MFSIYDVVAEVFNKPFTELNAASAIRAFTGAMKDNENRNDYQLIHIGEFDELNGTITPNNPVKIFTGFDIKSEE